MKKKLLLTLVLLFSLLLVAAAIGAYLYFSPEQTAQRKADNVMRLLLGNNPSSLSTYYRQADSLEQSIFQRNYHQKNSTSENSVLYVLYEFSDSQSPKYIRIGVDTQGEVRAIDYSDQLSEKPSNDPKKTQTTASSDRCLEKNDLAYLDSVQIYARSIRGATMIFLPNSTAYGAGSGASVLFTRLAGFYEKANEKDFVFEIKGYRQESLNTKEQADSDNLFQSRAVRLQQDLAAAGIPLARILISDAFNYSDPRLTTLDNANYIDMNILNRCIKE
ncbi:hypothetical protein I8H83_03455 [Candidatus Saccharibacteria bacterium]|nr:hypothetical protein [Candidatus Saccharibacteria bacterium]